MKLLIDWENYEIFEISGEGKEFPSSLLNRRFATKYKPILTIDDVMVFIKSASESELRSIKIALGAKDLKGKSKLAHFIYWKTESVKSFFRSVFQGVFYLKSFRISSLSLVNRVKVVDLCTKANYNVMDIQFVRKSIFYFQMLYKDSYTGYGYFIDGKEID